MGMAWRWLRRSQPLFESAVRRMLTEPSQKSTG